ncbi:hypothetical protein [Acinetobacter baumannii]|uniref:hypothetical protein n=1 Tax=Acinetobacter baumannii TaxID=470 RepID=UPI0027429297|nr:hypothetical protein [Acinetobacter baumannii]MDP7851024.1 hypothetical protein [Acinetobacter baumannii]
MFHKKLLLIFAFTSSPWAANAANVIPDQEAKVIYSPTITINPDELSSLYPESQMVKLLLSKDGYVKKVFYPEGVRNEVISKVDYALRTARFTPYLKQGKPVQSIVPYVVNFYFISEEEYRGH